MDGNKTKKTLLISALLMIILFCGCGKYVSKISYKNNTSTIIEAFNGAEIAANNYHIYLGVSPGRRPVVSSESISVRVDGKTITLEADFVLPKRVLDTSTGFYFTSPEATLAYLTDRTDPSDGYQTGTIKIIKSDLITSTSEVTVIYTYYKSIVGRYRGTGEAIVGPYILEGIKNVAPGSEIVQVWEQDSSVVYTYIRNSSFEADAGFVGYAFNYNKDNPSIIFNEVLDLNKNFQVVFLKYVDDEGDMAP